MNNRLCDIADVVVDRIAEFERSAIRPAYCIVGRVEYNALMADLREHPMLSTSREQGLTVLGLRIVPDFSSESRISITFDCGLINDRLHQKAQDKKEKGGISGGKTD